VTLVHSLEHFAEPLSTLRDLREKIEPEGRLFIEVPNANANPFDYVIADHMVHFNSEALARLLRRAGFQIQYQTTEWVAKEISTIAQHGPVQTDDAATETSSSVILEVRAQIDWLLRVVDAARRSDTAKRFGLFGSSIAATWLCSVLGERVSFFVEEDRNRIGRSHLGRPIVGPDQIPAGSVVFVGLAPQVAASIVARLGQRIQCLRLPPS
jgi:hypothetical protein